MGYSSPVIRAPPSPSVIAGLTHIIHGPGPNHRSVLKQKRISMSKTVTLSILLHHAERIQIAIETLARLTAGSRSLHTIHLIDDVLGELRVHVEKQLELLRSLNHG